MKDKNKYEEGRTGSAEEFGDWMTHGVRLNRAFNDDHVAVHELAGVPQSED